MAASAHAPTKLALSLLGLLLVGATTNTLTLPSVSASQNTNTAAAGAADATPAPTPPRAGAPTSTPQPTGAPANQTQKQQEEKAAVGLQSLNVSEVVRVDTDDKAESARAGLYNTVRVKIDNLAEWMKVSGNDPQKFFLYIDAYPLKAIRGRPVGPTSDYLMFDLERTSDEATQKSWRSILNRPALLPPRPRPVTVSVAYDNAPGGPGVLVGSAVANFSLVDINPFWSKVFAAFLIGALALFFLFAIKSDMLRDNTPPPLGTDKRGRPNRKPFSLGRSQMAFWFFLVITSYVFIWMVTGDVNTITNTVLGLIGISATTALGALLIDKNKDTEAVIQQDALSAEQAAMQMRVKELEEKVNATPPTATPVEVEELNSKRARLVEASRKMAAIPPPVTEDTAPKARNFFADILTGPGGVSFHRFQVVAWTIALGIIFLAQVFNSLLMPEFDGTLLALMGISNGTYLGFKFPEKEPAPSA